VRFVFTPPVWHERPFLSIAFARNGLRNFKCHSGLVHFAWVLNRYSTTGI
jgi:hypothetical protein